MRRFGHDKQDSGILHLGLERERQEEAAFRLCEHVALCFQPYLILPLALGDYKRPPLGCFPTVTLFHFTKKVTAP